MNRFFRSTFVSGSLGCAIMAGLCSTAPAIDINGLQNPNWDGAARRAANDSEPVYAAANNIGASSKAMARAAKGANKGAATKDSIPSVTAKSAKGGGGGGGGADAKKEPFSWMTAIFGVAVALLGGAAAMYLGAAAFPVLPVVVGAIGLPILWNYLAGREPFPKF